MNHTVRQTNRRAYRLGQRGVAAASVTTALALGIAGCGGGSTEPGGGGGGAGGDELKGLTGTIGSKDFSEQYILAHLTTELLNAHGADLKANTKLVGSTNVRTAFTSGELDGYWEYTGTAWITYFKQTTPITDPAKMFAAVKAKDAGDGIVWLDPAPLNNTYAMAVRTDKATKLGVKSLSDISGLPPAEQTFCIESEFSTRDDGFPGLKKAYGLNVPDKNVRMVDTGVIYSETAKDGSCNFGEVFQTDGRIANLKLTVLTDDKKFFPVYQGAFSVKKKTLDKYPALATIMATLSPKLTTEVMQQLNAKADVDGEDPQDIAIDWLTAQKLI